MQKNVNAQGVYDPNLATTHDVLGDVPTPSETLFQGRKLVIVGDVLHSRVARSNLELFTKLGGSVIFVAPPTLVPADLSALPNVAVHYDLDEVLGEKDYDAVMLLRIQAERMLGGAAGPEGSRNAGFFPSLEDYKLRYCLTNERAAMLPDNVPILHPAPINRGLEIASEVADSKRSLINHQIRNGVFLRMSVLESVLGNDDLLAPSADIRGKTVVNLFYENSTRTRFSFEKAEKNLGLNVMNFSASGSSVGKGESLKDTVTTLYAMGIDGIVIRHQDSGAAYRLAHSDWVDVPVVNAGDGTHAHPTQALLDALTLWQHFTGQSQLFGTVDMYGRML